MNNMPPMDMPQDFYGADMGGNFMPQGNMQQPPMDGGMPMDNGMSGQSEFDTNFDAGVEADEEQDPKKFIQQLTGKLSQSLRKYNEDNGQPDVDLNKYVTGMIVKQSMDGLSPEDAEEIIDKVKSNEDFNMDDGEQPPMMQPQEQIPNDSQGQEMPQPNQGGQTVNEWFSKRNNRHLSEIVTNDIIKGNKEEKPYKKATETYSYRKSPFLGPTF